MQKLQKNLYIWNNSMLQGIILFSNLRSAVFYISLLSYIHNQKIVCSVFPLVKPGSYFLRLRSVILAPQIHSD